MRGGRGQGGVSGVGMRRGEGRASNVVYKGSTPDAQGMHTGCGPVHPLSFPCTPLVHEVRPAIGPDALEAVAAVPAALAAGAIVVHMPIIDIAGFPGTLLWKLLR